MGESSQTETSSSSESHTLFPPSSSSSSPSSSSIIPPVFISSPSSSPLPQAERSSEGPGPVSSSRGKRPEESRGKQTLKGQEEVLLQRRSCSGWCVCVCVCVCII
ncbi:unnamed protein product [Leuciscus chuanchicus]